MLSAQIRTIYWVLTPHLTAAAPGRRRLPAGHATKERRHAVPAHHVRGPPGLWLLRRLRQDTGEFRCRNARRIDSGKSAQQAR